jgi:hypothetical protein
LWVAVHGFLAICSNNNNNNNRNQDTSHPLFLQSPTHPSSPSYRNRQVQPPRVGGFNLHAYPLL